MAKKMGKYKHKYVISEAFLEPKSVRGGGKAVGIMRLTLAC